MNKKITLFSALALTATAAVAATAFAIAKPSKSLHAVKGVGTYSCAKVNFGMKDNNQGGVEESGFGTGYVSSVGTTYTKAQDYTSNLPGTTTGITMTKFRSDTDKNVNQLKAGQEYTKNKVKYTAINDHGLKFAVGTMTFTFGSNITGATIWVDGWKESTDDNTISCNGSTPQAISIDSNVTGTIYGDELNVTYQKFTFEFDSTNALALTFTRRGFIGHIALRVANS